MGAGNPQASMTISRKHGYIQSTRVDKKTTRGEGGGGEDNMVAADAVGGDMAGDMVGGDLIGGDMAGDMVVGGVGGLGIFEWRLYDTSSCNGMFVNKQKVQNYAALHDEDTITFGDHPQHQHLFTYKFKIL